MKEMSHLKMRTQNLNLTLLDNSRRSSKMRMSRQMTMIANRLDSLNLIRIDSRENPKKLDKTTTLRLVQNVIGVKGTER